MSATPPEIRRVQTRRGTQAQWTAENPVLEEGEMGLVMDVGRFKVGNGTDDWDTLPYWIDEGPQGPQGAQGAQGGVAGGGFDGGGP
jgi:hypothetical protein